MSVTDVNRSKSAVPGRKVFTDTILKLYRLVKFFSVSGPRRQGKRAESVRLCISGERKDLMNVIGIKVNIIGGLFVPEQLDQGARLKHAGERTAGRLPRCI